MIWVFGHKQVSPGCTLSEEAVDALLPEETSTLLRACMSTKLTSYHGELHLSKISSYPFNFEAFPRKVNKPGPDVSSLAVPGGPAQGLKSLWFLIVLQWGSTQECGACWWAPAPSWQQWQCGGSPRSCLRSHGTRRSKFVTSPYHVRLVSNTNLFSVSNFQLYRPQRVVGNQRTMFCNNCVSAEQYDDLQAPLCFHTAPLQKVHPALLAQPPNWAHVLRQLIFQFCGWASQSFLIYRPVWL